MTWGQLMCGPTNLCCKKLQFCRKFQIEYRLFVSIRVSVPLLGEPISFHDRVACCNVSKRGPSVSIGHLSNCLMHMVMQTCLIFGIVVAVMAAELVRAAREEGKRDPERLRFFYYTAGTGGAGPTILATSFLLLGEDVIAYGKGEKVKLKPYSGMLNIDFGKGVRKKNVFLLNLPEVRTAHEVLRIPTVSARFGTAPFFWNWGMALLANLLPQEFLRDRRKVQQLVDLFDPVVRAVDGIAGERVSMRVDLECSNGRNTLGIFTHRRLSVSVGFAVSAFVLAVLEGSTQPGVWFPEEPEGIAVQARKLLLERASQGTINFVMNKPPWMVETEPKEIGLGIYL